uniref:Uncharacterized protein n=1 Tax=Onchocerca volvulus TaxID=6282 RepID=A0A8R1TX60_ONCVO
MKFKEMFMFMSAMCNLDFTHHLSSSRRILLLLYLANDQTHGVIHRFCGLCYSSPGVLLTVLRIPVPKKRIAVFSIFFFGVLFHSELNLEVNN